ncbi:hypothetical protein ACJMK2_023985 [Sinanodonta woodiana]|uniref:Uncharacterized protein n=1 Tax=Sinanodonta woodiana TaxID=1069815 RepID=A0ABD3T7B4_SINWO
MKHSCIEVIFMTVLKALPVLSIDLHHSNSYDPKRLIRSANITGSLDQTKTPSIVNCYNSACVLNEEFCNETSKKCEKCRYEHGECTNHWECFGVCIELKAQEICSGSEGSGEATGSPWWPYLMLVIFIISLGFNIFFVIKTLHIHERCEKLKKNKSNDASFDKEETSAMLPGIPPVNNAQSNQQQMTSSTDDLPSQQTDNAPDSDPQTRGPITEESVNTIHDTISVVVTANLSENKL